MTIRQTLNPDGDLPGAVPAAENSSHNVRSMAKLLQTGTSSQKTLILFEMPQLLANCRQETLNILVPAICLFVEQWDEDLQIATAEALLDVVHQATPIRTKGIIIQAALHVIRDSDSEDLLECWGEILVMILPTAKLEHDAKIMSITDILDEFANSELSVCRKLASRVFGAVAPSMTADSVEAHILDNALKLVDDPDPEIRGMTAESMAFIGAVTGAETTEVRVWPKIWGLLQDSDVRIRAVTLRTISFILEGQRKRGLNILQFSKLLYPVLLEQASFAFKAATEDQRTIDNDTFLMLEITSEVFGQFLYSCASHFEDNDAVMDSFFKTFYAMATCNSPPVRRFCAYNLPGVCLSWSSKYIAQLAQIAHALSTDMDSETRCNLAAGIHETTLSLNNAETVDCLVDAVATLLRDENPVVRMNILENFFTILSVLAKALETDAMDRLAPLFQNLTILYEGNWRTQEMLANQLQDAARIVPVEALRKYILPLLYRLAEDSTYVVRKSAMTGIAKTLWHIPIQSERADAMRTFRIEWGEGGVYWMRMAFIDCAEAAMGCYSRKLFNQLFLESLLYLTDDPVANVRLRLGRVVPKLAHFCFGTSALDRVISALKIDHDPDVRDIMHGIELELEAVERNRGPFETEDIRREDAEVQMRDNAMRAMNKIENLDTTKSITPQVTEACTPVSSEQNETGVGSPPKIIGASLRDSDAARDEEETMNISRPVSPKRGLKPLRLQLGMGAGKEERESATNLSLPKIVISPINSPEAGNQDEQGGSEIPSEKPLSPRRKGLQILRDLGWVRKR